MAKEQLSFELYSTNISEHLMRVGGLPWWLSGKESTCLWRRYKRHSLDPWVWKIPWRRKWQPTPVLLPGKSHGERSMAGYSPWGRKKLSNFTSLHYELEVGKLGTTYIHCVYTISLGCLALWD